MPFNLGGASVVSGGLNGTLWTATSGTGTGVALAAVITAFANTTPVFVIQNKGPVAVWPKWLRLLASAVPTTSVVLNLAAIVDSAAPTITNGGTVPTNFNQDGRDTAAASVAVITPYKAAGALSITAPSNAARTVCRAQIVTGVPVANDEYLFQFANPDLPWTQNSAGLTAARATDPATMVSQGAPWSIASGSFGYIYLWTPAGVGASTYEWELGWYEA